MSLPAFASFAVLCVFALRILSVENSQRKDAKDRKARKASAQSLWKREEFSKSYPSRSKLFRNNEYNPDVLVLNPGAGREVVEGAVTVPQVRTAEHGFDDVSLCDWYSRPQLVPSRQQAG